MKDLQYYAERMEDNDEYALAIKNTLTDAVNNNSLLKLHRDYVERLAYGFGERAFHYVWKMLVDEMPDDFSFLEIGVYKGQVLTLMKMLAIVAEKEASITGITMLSAFGGDQTTFPESDYAYDIAHFHRHFAIPQPKLIVGDSTSQDVHNKAAAYGPYDIVYIDGCHDYDFAYKDLEFYRELVKPGGYLVVDDCCCRKHEPWGFFQGIEGVCQAVSSTVELDPRFEELMWVVHLRVWRRN